MNAAALVYGQDYGSPPAQHFGYGGLVNTKTLANLRLGNLLHKVGEVYLLHWAALWLFSQIVPKGIFKSNTNGHCEINRNIYAYWA